MPSRALIRTLKGLNKLIRPLRFLCSYSNISGFKSPLKDLQKVSGGL
jgi:hypothetical protein